MYFLRINYYKIKRFFYTIIKYISELRKKLGLSLVAFSKPLKCSPTQIKRMEIGTVIPNEDFIKCICQVYNIDP